MTDWQQAWTPAQVSFKTNRPINTTLILTLGKNDHIFYEYSGPQGFKEQNFTPNIIYILRIIIEGYEKNRLDGEHERLYKYDSKWTNQPHFYFWHWSKN